MRPSRSRTRTAGSSARTYRARTHSWIATAAQRPTTNPVTPGDREAGDGERQERDGATTASTAGGRVRSWAR